MATATTRTRMVSALFHDRPAADKAYQVLVDRKYTRDEVTIAMSEDARKRHAEGTEGERVVEVSEDNNAMEGAGVGGALGSITGGLIGAIAAIGTSLVMPGLGLIVAGPLAAGLAGAGAGGLTGGVVGALVGWGLPEEHAQVYETGLREGAIVIGVNPRSDAEAQAIEDEWRACGADRIDRI